MIESLWNVSLSISVLILLLLLFAPILKRRFCAQSRSLIWLILAIRLIIPFHFSLPDPPIEIPFPTALLDENKLPEPDISAPLSSPTVSTAPSALPESNDISSFLPPDMNLLEIGWFCGVLLLGGYYLITYFLFCRKVRRCSIPAKIECGRPRVYYCGIIESPMLIGFIRPRILLPDRIYTNQELSMILAHELTHYRRHDLWYKLLLIMANAMHWFNPLVWYMVRRANRDLEYSCDSSATQNMDLETKKFYSSVLLHLAAARTNRTMLSTYFSGGKKDMKERIANILYAAKKKKGIVICAVVLCFALTAGALVSFPQWSQAFAQEYIPPYQEVNIFPLYNEESTKELLNQFHGASIHDENLQAKLEEYYMIPDNNATYQSPVTLSAITLQTQQKPYEIEFAVTDNYGIPEEQIRLQAYNFFILVQDADKITFELSGKDQKTISYERENIPISFEKYTDPQAYFVLMMNLRYAEEQKKADEGEELWRLDPREVVWNYLKTCYPNLSITIEDLILEEKTDTTCTYLTPTIPSTEFDSNLPYPTETAMSILVYQPFSLGEKGIWVPLFIGTHVETAQ